MTACATAGTEGAGIGVDLVGANGRAGRAVDSGAGVMAVLTATFAGGAGGSCEVHKPLCHEVIPRVTINVAPAKPHSSSRWFMGDKKASQAPQRRARM